MEKEIFELLISLAYKSKINELYLNKNTHFEYPLKIEELPFDVLLDFNKIYYKQYLDILLKNALVYIIDNNIEKILKLFKGDRNLLEELIKNDEVFQASITKYAFNNLKLKFVLDQNNDQKIIESNKDLFNNICNHYKINSLTYIYRKIILDFLKTFDSSDSEIILDRILLTNEYNNDLIKQNKLLNNDNINTFKYILFRLILSDNYIDIKNNENNSLLTKDINDLFIECDEENDYENEFIDYNENEYELDIIYTTDEKVILEMEKKLLNYIENTLTNNKFLLPNDIEIRYNLYSKFINYNLYISEQKYNIEKIKEDKENFKQLKKINPYYSLDLLKNDY